MQKGLISSLVLAILLIACQPLQTDILEAPCLCPIQDVPYCDPELQELFLEAYVLDECNMLCNKPICVDRKYPASLENAITNFGKYEDTDITANKVQLIINYFDIGKSEENYTFILKTIYDAANETGVSHEDLIYWMGVWITNEEPPTQDFFNATHNMSNMLREMSWVINDGDGSIPIASDIAKREPEIACEVDADCTLITTGCCNCDFKAINANYEQKLNCSNAICGLSACVLDSYAKCQEGVCILLKLENSSN